MEKEIEKRFEKAEKRLDNLESTIAKSSLSRPGKLIKCVFCGWTWKTQSEAEKVSCPSCGNKTPTDPKEMKKAEEESSEKVKKVIKKVEERNKKYPTRFR